MNRFEDFDYWKAFGISVISLAFIAAFVVGMVSLTSSWVWPW